MTPQKDRQMNGAGAMYGGTSIPMAEQAAAIQKQRFYNDTADRPSSVTDTQLEHIGRRIEEIAQVTERIRCQLAKVLYVGPAANGTSPVAPPQVMPGTELGHSLVAVSDALQQRVVALTELADSIVL